MRTILLCVCIIFTGCSGGSSKSSDDGTGSLEAALAAGVSIGQSVSLAMQAMTGSTVCASVKTACPSFPCDGAVTITYGSACPLPLGGEVSGTVNVTGSWQSADSATLSDTFVGVMAGAKSEVVVNAKNLSVTRSGKQITVRYTWQDVSVLQGVSTLGAQSSWTTTVDTDTYTVSGVDQGVSTAVSQLSASNVVIAPDCRLNPVSGSATIQKVSLPSIINATVSFHSTCDGKAEMNGSSIALDFLH